MAIYNINYSLSGDPNNTSSGAISVTFQNDNPSTLLIWVTPSLSPTNLGQSNSFTINSLSGGSYAFYLQDFASPPSISNVVSFFISTGTCVSINEVTPTTCSSNNGIILASTSNVYGVQSFKLFDSTNTQIDGNTTGAFLSLSPGLYYVIGDDGGGATGRSQNCIVQESAPLEFELYVVNNSSCTNNLGKVYVTNLNGTQPFTYTWSNGVTGVDFITGLTTGVYNLTITDYYGCQQTKSALVDYDEPIGIGSLTVTQPTCFSADGQVTIIITGGTAPFYFSGSNGYTEISFLPEMTFTGLSPGNFYVEVTDAGLCKYNTSTFLVTPNSFVVDQVTLTPSRCGGIKGQITVTLLNNGLTSPAYTYQLYDPVGNLLQTQTTTALYNTFSGLSSNTYTVEITDIGSACVFQQNYTLVNYEPFVISTLTTGTTCNTFNGSLYVEVSEYGSNPSYPPFTIGIAGPNNTTYNSTAISSTTFNFLAGGFYTVTVQDQLGCSLSTTAYIEPSVNVDFIMIPVTSVLSNQNSITTFITQGEPPFTVNWLSNNVNGQTTLSVNNLSAGTYTLEVTDADLCVRTKSVVIEESTFFSSSGDFTICNKSFGDVNYIKKGILQMVSQGFTQLTPGGVGCVLTSVTFTSEVIVNGTSYTNQFFSGSSFTNLPSDNQWGDSIKNTLLTIYGVGNVIIDYITNTITIQSDCNLPGNILAGAIIQINLLISYGIACISSDTCCGIISEDGNTPPEGPNYCLIVEDNNAGIANFKIVIETDY